MVKWIPAFWRPDYCKYKNFWKGLLLYRLQITTIWCMLPTIIPPGYCWVCEQCIQILIPLFTQHTRTLYILVITAPRRDHISSYYEFISFRFLWLPKTSRAPLPLKPEILSHFLISWTSGIPYERFRYCIHLNTRKAAVSHVVGDLPKYLVSKVARTYYSIIQTKSRHPGAFQKLSIYLQVIALLWGHGGLPFSLKCIQQYVRP